MLCDFLLQEMEGPNEGVDGELLLSRLGISAKKRRSYVGSSAEIEVASKLRAPKCGEDCHNCTPCLAYNPHCQVVGLTSHA